MLVALIITDLGRRSSKRRKGGHTSGVLDVADVEGSLVLLLVGDGADTPAVTSASDHAEVADAELDEVLDLASLDVKHDRVVLLEGDSRKSWNVH